MKPTIMLPTDVNSNEGGGGVAGIPIARIFSFFGREAKVTLDCTCHLTVG